MLDSETPLYMHVYIRGIDTPHVWLPYNDDTPTLLAQQLDLSLKAIPITDVYFSPHLYFEPDYTLSPDIPMRSDATCAPTRTLAVDVDNADLMYLPLLPSNIVRTSISRHQVYYVFDNEITQELSKQLVLSVAGSDMISYKFGHMLRLPTTYNHKYNPPYQIRVTQDTRIVHAVEDLMPSTNGHRPYTEEDLLIQSPIPPTLKPQTYLDQLGLSPSVTLQFNNPAADPMAALKNLIVEMLHKHVPRENIFFMCKQSTNNPFATLAYNQEYELAKYILKLETASSTPDTLSMARRIRNTTATQEERHELMYEVVRECMISNGNFYHTKQGTMWYVPNDAPSSVLMSHRSASLQYYLNRTFGLNTTDYDTQYVIPSLLAFVSGLPQTTVESKLSHYSKPSNRLLIHTGTSTVFNVTPSRVDTIHNGEYGVLFHPLSGIFMPFIPHDGPITLTSSIPDPLNPIRRKVITIPYDTWNEALFGPFLDNIQGLTHDEAKALLSAWFLFLFFKNAAPARPLLAIFGQPGSGKSTIMKRIAYFLYGKKSGIVGVTTPQEYDHVTFAYPLAVFDNVDTWERWLSDRLAQSAGALDNTRRTQYTDDQTTILTKDAMVAVTSHDPKFSRPDIADRLLILRKSRFDVFEDEAELMVMPRAAMWYDMIHDLSIILATPRPYIPEQLRVQDFASLGSWIASGLDLLTEFQSAISKIRIGQKSFALDNDAILLDACISYVTRSKTAADFKSPSQIYADLEFMHSLSGDPTQFSKKYRNPTLLNNKLYAAQDALSANLDIQVGQDEYGRRTWRIQRKQTPQIGDTPQ